MNHKDEYNKLGTIHGWSEEDAKNSKEWLIILKFKDVKKKTTMIERASIIIADLMQSNGQEPDHDEVFVAASKIVVMARRRKID